MVIRQRVTLNPTPDTFPAFLPVGPDPAAIHVRVADAATGRTLGNWPTRPTLPNAFDAAQVREPVFVGTSGESPSLRFLDRANHAVAYLPPRDLPRRAIGFDGLDVLMLDRPDLTRLDPDQQAAAAAWVRAGGRLVIWPGINPIPPDSPIGKLMPAEVVDFATRETAAGATPFVRLAGVADDELVTTVERGLGRVVFLHVPPDTLHTLGVEFVPGDPRPTIEPPKFDDSVVRAAAARASTTTPSWLVAALAIAAIIGPIDWMVLRRTRRRVRPWVTLPGWLALFALLTFYLPGRESPSLRAMVKAAPTTAVATVVGDGPPAADADRAATESFDAAGVAYWALIGFDRTAGPTRDVVFGQGDGGMPLDVAGRGRTVVRAVGTAMPD